LPFKKKYFALCFKAIAAAVTTTKAAAAAAAWSASPLPLPNLLPNTAKKPFDC